MRRERKAPRRKIDNEEREGRRETDGERRTEREGRGERNGERGTERERKRERRMRRDDKCKS